MIRTIALLTTLAALACALGCGSSVTNDPPPPPPEGLFGDLSFGDDGTLDIVTWNLQTFPRSGETTREYVVEAIQAMDADVIAIQEIMSWTSFRQVIEALEEHGYDGHYATSDDYMDLGYLWKTSTVTGTSFSEPLTWSTPFPRYPLVMRMTFAGQAFTLINNHLKCCGDGTLVDGYEDDEEYRRALACDLMESWIADHAADDHVVLMGDLNDRLDDAEADNVFNVFLNDPTHYRFADLPLAPYSESASWSWRLRSHIDHILITDELFTSLEHADAEVRTLRLDIPLEGGISEYNDVLSDHFPVGVRLVVTP